MRGLLLPFVMAIAVCGLVTASTYLGPTGAVDRAQQRVEPTPTTPFPATVRRHAGLEADLDGVVTSTALPPSTTLVSSAPESTLPLAPTPTTIRTSAARVAAQSPVAQPTAAPVQQLPLPYSGSAGQVITVVGASSAATTAQLTAWTRSGTGWLRAIGPITANVGSAGIGKASESTTRTPAGVFGLTEAFGILGDNGTRLPYRQVDTSDWWVSDVDSTAYNTHYRCAPGSCPFDESAGENLGKAGTAYNHAVVINYNRSPIVPGAGSAFFLHVTTGKATAGCVAVPSASLDAVMRWLDPAQHPVIDIGVA